jgi:hypothetical protein
MSLRNTDYTDRELLMVMADVANNGGLILGLDVADRLGYPKDPDDEKPPREVTGRLAWMKRYGFVDRIDPRSIGLKGSEPPRYVITPAGQAIMGGRISAAVERELDKGDPGTEVLLMRSLATRGFIEGRDWEAAAIRREWLHNAAKRPR